MLQKEPGPFKSPPLSPEDGESCKVELGSYITIVELLMPSFDFNVGLLLRKATSSVSENDVLRKQQILDEHL